MPNTEVLKHKKKLERARETTLEKLKRLDSKFFETYRGNQPDHLADLELQVSESSDILQEAAEFAQGFQLDTGVLGYHIQAYTAKNRCGAIIKKGDIILARIVYKNTGKYEIARTSARTKALQDPVFSGIYSALTQKFVENLQSLEAKRTSKLIAPKIINEIYLTSTFLANEYDSLESFLINLSEYFQLNPVTVCGYLRGPGLLTKNQRSGISKYLSKFSAENKQIMEFWNETEDIQNLEERLRLVADKANLDPATVCYYLGAPDMLPDKERRGMSSLRNKFLAETKQIQKLWNETKHIPGLEERIKKTAELADIDPTTAGIYLCVPGILTKEQRLGISKVNARFSARKQHIRKLWNQTKHIPDLEERIRILSNKTNLAPTTICTYLRAPMGMPKKEKIGISTLLSKFSAETKQILNFWKETEDIQTLEERLRIVAGIANISPATVCMYLVAPDILPNKEKRGMNSLKNKFLAENKQIIKYWNETANLSGMKERVIQVAVSADLAPVTACNYLIASGGLPVEQRAEIQSLRTKFVKKGETVFITFMQFRKKMGVEDALLETAKYFKKSLKSVHSSLYTLLPKAERIELTKMVIRHKYR